jgi:hypothetical protein
MRQLLRGLVAEALEDVVDAGGAAKQAGVGQPRVEVAVAGFDSSCAAACMRAPRSAWRPGCASSESAQPMPLAPECRAATAPCACLRWPDRVDLLLDAGSLRSPRSHLQRADAVVLRESARPTSGRSIVQARTCAQRFVTLRSAPAM